MGEMTGGYCEFKGTFCADKPTVVENCGAGRDIANEREELVNSCGARALEDYYGLNPDVQYDNIDDVRRRVYVLNGPPLLKMNTGGEQHA